MRIGRQRRYQRQRQPSWCNRLLLTNGVVFFFGGSAVLVPVTASASTATDNHYLRPAAAHKTVLAFSPSQSSGWSRRRALPKQHHSRQTSLIIDFRALDPKTTGWNHRALAHLPRSASESVINYKKHSTVTTTLWSSLKDENDTTVIQTDWSKVALFGIIGFFYWYWMVLGSLGASLGWPGIPDALPLVPGWPPSDADLVPVLEDSQHFFYLSEVLQNQDAPYVQPVRLAAFNVAEAWIFGFLPALWKDPKRTNRWILLGTWAVLGINLTNAFLAPYLLVTELQTPSPSPSTGKNPIVSTLFAGIISLVTLTAIVQCATVATTDDWSEFGRLIQSDRTYLAFCVDLILFSIFQPIILARIRSSEDRAAQPTTADRVPLIGLILWLLEGTLLLPDKEEA